MSACGNDESELEWNTFLSPAQQWKTNSDTTYTGCFPSPTHNPRAPDLGRVSSQSTDVPHSFTPFIDRADVCECLGLCGCMTCSVHKARISTVRTLNSWSNPLSVQSICRAKNIALKCQYMCTINGKKNQKAPGGIQTQEEVNVAYSLNANAFDSLWWNMVLLFQLKVCVCASLCAFIMD